MKFRSFSHYKKKFLVLVHEYTDLDNPHHQVCLSNEKFVWNLSLVLVAVPASMHKKHIPMHLWFCDHNFEILSHSAQKIEHFELCNPIPVLTQSHCVVAAIFCEANLICSMVFSHMETFRCVRLFFVISQLWYCLFFFSSSSLGGYAVFIITLG